jgi:iron(III) transport system substrate-binding protein
MWDAGGDHEHQRGISPMNILQPVSRRRLLQAAGATAAALTLPLRADAQQSMVWYSASGSKPDEDWSQLFKTKTGGTVEFFRIGGVKLTERIEQEFKAKQVKFSAVDMSIPGLMSDWAKKGLLTKYESPEQAHYPADARMPGFWTPVNALTVTIAFNADHIKPEEAPKKWEDLLDPKWKGKMCMSDALYSGAIVQAFAAFKKVLGKSFVEKLAKQDILVRNGSGETTQTLISGERPLAAMVLEYYIADAMDKGANLYVVQPDVGVPATFEVIGMPAAAPNPELGKKFIDFALSKEAQQLWQDKHGTRSMRDDLTPIKAVRGRRTMKDLKLMASTGADMEDSFVNQRALLDEWINLFK